MLFTSIASNSLFLSPIYLNIIFSLSPYLSQHFSSHFYGQIHHQNLYKQIHHQNLHSKSHKSSPTELSRQSPTELNHQFRQKYLEIGTHSVDRPPCDEDHQSPHNSSSISASVSITTLKHSSSLHSLTKAPRLSSCSSKKTPPCANTSKTSALSVLICNLFIYSGPLLYLSRVRVSLILFWITMRSKILKMYMILVGRQLKEYGVLSKWLRSQSNLWGLHMLVVCPDGVVVAYAWKHQLDGQADAREREICFRI